MRRGETAAHEASTQPIGVELIAMLVAVADGRPLAMTIEDGRALPSGPFEVGHRSLQSGLSAWVERQTGHPLGYVEQLYTFANSDRRAAADGERAISISYLGLMREERTAVGGVLAALVRLFPWEDHRAGAPPIIRDAIAPGLNAGSRRRRRSRAADARRHRLWPRGRPWNEDLVCSAMSFFMRRVGGEGGGRGIRGSNDRDHRRILATGSRASCLVMPPVYLSRGEGRGYVQANFGAMRAAAVEEPARPSLTGPSMSA